MFAQPLAAQSLVEGYASSVQPLPAAAGTPAALHNGVAWFDGVDVAWQETGQPVRSLLHFAVPRFGGFQLPLGQSGLLFADSSLGETWLLSTAPNAQPVLLTSIVLPYDAVQLDATTAIVSARIGGFGAAVSDLLLLDLASGAVTPLGSVPGASGAIALDGSGNLLYATAPLAFPPPAGSVEVLQWNATQLLLARLGAQPLGRANAQVLTQGLDAAGDIALDGDDDLLFVDWLNGRIGEVSDLHGPALHTDLVDYASASVSGATLQFVPGASGGAFEPFALGSGGTLLVHETDFFSQSQLRAIAAQPTQFACSAGTTVPRGPFALTVAAAPRQGIGLFALGFGSAPSPLALALPGFEQPLAWDSALLAGSTALALFDAQGNAQLALNNPGVPLGLRIVTACAFVDATARVLGATIVLPLTLAP